VEYKDYYKIMGVVRDASQDEIKRSYRKLARKYHPDVSKEADAEARFKELGEAYEVLKDPEKRLAYDQLGANWKTGQEFHAPPNWDAGFEFSGGGFPEGTPSSFSDFFESLFGQGYRSTEQRGAGGFNARTQDHHAKILINLEDALQGATQTITLQMPEVDTQGRLQTKQRVLNVRIPQGIKQGQQIRLSGQGAPGEGKIPSGDLYLEIEFRAHPYYRVEGKDLYLNLPIAPWEAALGSTVKVPTPAGTVDLKIPPESANGQILRLKDRGIPSKPPGNLYVILQVALPPAKTKVAREIYNNMREKLAFNPRLHLGVEQ